MSNPAGTKRRLQVTGHRKFNKKVRHSAGLFMFIYLFHSGYVIIRHMFGIDHASLCSKSKRTTVQFLLSFKCPEISKRSFVFASCEETWNKVLRMERNSLVNAKSNRAKGESFKVRKQLQLTSYFEISSTEDELKNYLANQQQMSALLTMDCTAITSCRFRFVAAHINVFIVVIKLSDGIS